MFFPAAALIGRAAGALSRVTGRGSGGTLPGRLTVAMCPDALERLTAGRTVVLVSGTNGKTTTTRLLSAALASDRPVVSNTTGSNLERGLVTALLNGARDAAAVLEVDEVVLPRAMAGAKPAAVVLLNLSRDQLDRTSEVAFHVRRWSAAIGGTSCTIVANADDPLIVHAIREARSADENVIWVAAGRSWRADSPLCPRCDHAWDVEATPWTCDNCGFARPDSRWSADEVVLDGGSPVGLTLQLPGRVNVSNAAMALAAAAVLGVESNAAAAAMSAVTDIEGRYLTRRDGDREARLFLVKNPSGWVEAMPDAAASSNDGLVISINARSADGRDPSWLWDVPFEALGKRHVVVTGERATDLATRLHYAGVSYETQPDPQHALEVLPSGRSDVVANYTAFGPWRTAFTAVPQRSATEPSKVTTNGSPARPSVAHAGTSSSLRIVCVLPTLLGTYGDGGNGLVLRQRALWRGIAAELVLTTAHDPMPSGGDLYLFGGGEDRAQMVALELLIAAGAKATISSGVPVLAVCAGLQLLGATLPGSDGAIRAGLEVVDIATTRLQQRAVGDVLARTDSELGWIVGFANHQGSTRLGPGVTPFGAIVAGPGNEGAGSAAEGFLHERVVGTYLHGPVLARNPQLADRLLEMAAGGPLAPLPEGPADRLHDERVAAAQQIARRRVSAVR